MGDASLDGRQRLIDPIDRVSEILFGLIMAVTIVGSLSVAAAGHQDVRTVMAAALGCNLAWGLVDAVMYLIRTLTERTRDRTLAKEVIDLDPDAGCHLIAASLPEHVAAITGPEELAGMRRRLLAGSMPARSGLGWDDYQAAAGIFLLVVVATFPVVIPFMLITDVALAMNISRVTSLAMLFLGGFVLGRYAGHAHPTRTGLVMAVLGAVLIAAVKALGG